jgi:predicted MPP superfamily phosphohydrolase
MKIIAIILVLLAIYVIWQKLELQKFRVTEYTVEAEKVQYDFRMAVIADLHCHEYGENNERLLDTIKKQKPDAILIPGDMIISAHTEKYEIALRFLQKVSEIAPVYFSNGNHESRIDRPQSPYYEFYQAYRNQVEKAGVHILNNEKEVCTISGNNCIIYGADIPLDCYQKGKINPLPVGFLEEKLGVCDCDRFSVLLAHNPTYCDDYASWGADLILSGHMHGGLVRIPGMGSVISPQFKLFPKYDAGRFCINHSTAIISKGLGTHTFHIRIFNRAEVVMIQVKSKQNH